jgi:hypothetical protein
LTVGAIGVVVGGVGLASDESVGATATLLVGLMLIADAIATLFGDRWPRAVPVLRVASFVLAIVTLVVVFGGVFGAW